MVMKRVLIMALAGRVIFGIYAFASPLLFPLNAGYLGQENFPHLNAYFASWANFDGRHFAEIATQGYLRSNYVYFPLYPLTIKLTNQLAHFDPVIAGQLLSLGFFVVSTVVLTKFVKLEPKLAKSKSYLWIFCFFPFSFYYSAVYSEALYFLLATAAFYLARKGRWSGAFILTTLVCLTHITGLTIVPALMIEAYLQRETMARKRFVAVVTGVGLAGLLGPGLYGLFLYLTRGNALLFMTSYAAWQREEITFPLVVFWRYFNIFLHFEPKVFVFWVALIEFVTASIYMYLCWICLKYIRLSYGVFILATLVLSMMSGSFLGFPRYTTHLFPAYMAIAHETNRLSGRARIQIAAIFVLLGYIFTSLFFRGYYLA